MTHKYLFLCLFFTVLFSSSYSQDKDNMVHYRQISMDVYRDKVEGGWLGQAIGVLWAEDTEGKWQSSVVPFDLEDWYQGKAAPKEIFQKAIPDYANKYWWKSRKPGWWKERENLAKWWYNDKNNWVKFTPKSMSNQDDLYLEFMFLHSIQKYGLDVTQKQVAEDWLKYLDQNQIWSSNNEAYGNFLKGMWPPYSGKPENNAATKNLTFRIEADLFGLINPGMPRASNAWCDKFGHIVSYGDGVYAGMALAAMFSEAFFESDPRKLIEYGLQAIPFECDYARMTRDVLDAHKKYEKWEDAWKIIYQKWALVNGEPNEPGDAKANGAFVYIGLLYGEGDFWKSINISMRCGKDSDCNPSSVGGILGTVLGMKAIPSKWAVLRNLPIENKAIREIYPQSIVWNDIINQTIEIGKWNILHNSGYLSNNTFFIPHLSPISAAYEN